MSPYASKRLSYPQTIKIKMITQKRSVSSPNISVWVWVKSSILIDRQYNWYNILIYSLYVLEPMRAEMCWVHYESKSFFYHNLITNKLIFLILTLWPYNFVPKIFQCKILRQKRNFTCFWWGQTLKCKVDRLHSKMLAIMDCC